MRWEYRDVAGNFLGLVYRFRTSDGGKEVLPCVYARHQNENRCEWRWMQWREPRPLYLPGGLHDDRKVLVVEGEKCADAAQAVFGEKIDVVTWSGGAKATSKADWAVLAGKKIVIWPDCDAKREPLTLEEKENAIEANSKAFLPEVKQPGMIAAEQIATHLTKYGCDVRIVEIPQPGERSDGWDIADAIAENSELEVLWGWLKHLRIPISQLPKSPLIKNVASSILQADKSAESWQIQLIRGNKGAVEDCYQNVYLILKHHPEWQGCIAFDEFLNRPVKLRMTPAGTEMGAWEAYDDQCLGLWLARHIGMLIKSDGPIAQGVAMIARENSMHPVRDYLTGLRGKWDWRRRLDIWLSQCMNAKATEAGEEYLQVVGRKSIISAVARIMRPGCKVDTMMVFEGGQGRGKSAAIRILGGEWFSDTTLDLSSKDCYLSLNGVWMYEIAEMDAFNRADATRVKAFVSSAVDQYREPYSRREIIRPRQQIFIGTTNQKEYFKDPTGNRRFWPVRIQGQVNLDLLRAWRNQLFAEALYRFEAGEIWYPTRDEEFRLFRVEQEFREVPDPWQERIEHWLTSSDAALHSPLTVDVLLSKAISIEPGRIGSAKQEAMRVANAMSRLGAIKKRESGGMRRYYYELPQSWQALRQDAASAVSPL